MDKKEIGEAFSRGSFEAAYEHFAAGIQWQIIGDQLIEGKQNVIAHCEKMLEGMDTASLHNTNVIAQGDSVAIEGYCKFQNDEGKPAEVNYCDIYSFEDGKVVKITSYCISFALN